MTDKPAPTYAWHFLKLKNGAPVYRDGTPAHVGDVLTHDGPLVICESGLHYSYRLVDAPTYASGAILCRVKIDGAQDQHEDKGVCRRREIVWMADITPILRPFARWCAATVLHLWNAPEIVVRYLATGDETIRAAAGDAARAAAWDAARDAAGDAQNEMLTSAVAEAMRLSGYQYPEAKR